MKFGIRVHLKPSNDRGEFELDWERSKNKIAEKSFALGHETHNSNSPSHPSRGCFVMLRTMLGNSIERVAVTSKLVYKHAMSVIPLPDASVLHVRRISGLFVACQWHVCYISGLSGLSFACQVTSMPEVHQRDKNRTNT